MRTQLLAGVILLAATSSSAFAQNVAVAGTFDVKFDEAGSTCNPPPVTYTKGKVIVEENKQGLTVNIETVPQMVGGPAKKGSFKATTSTPKATTVQGLDAKYTISGRVDETGVLAVVLVAEYQANKKPYCVQSWNISGIRSASTKK
jgi:hypothetical protein